MKRGLCGIAVGVLVCGAAALAMAQSAGPSAREPADNPEWHYGAFVDGSYIDDPDDPANDVFRSRGTTWHVNNWHINMAGIYAKKKATAQSRWGAEILAQDGKDDEIFGYSATAPNLKGSEGLRHLGLANVSYLAPLGKGLIVQGGIFGSLIGYDSLYAKDNFNYTRPWGADFTPYLMLGVNASYPFSDRLTGTFFVVNGYWHLADANHVPSVGGQAAYTLTDNDTFKETVLFGPHQADTSFKFWRWISDTIVEHKIDRATLALEYNVAAERVDTARTPTALWMSAQLPVHVAIHGPWSVSVRPEVAWDRDGRWTLAKQTVEAVTTTVEYRVPYKWLTTILRGEYRVDDSRGPEGGFFKGPYIAPGVVGLTPTQNLFIFAAIFTFDSPAPR